MSINDWFGCYTPYPKDLVVPESFTHPAKLPPSLMFRILARLEALGLKRGGKILDPFAGIGGTLLCGGLLGYQCYGMELEETFVKLTGQNIAKNKHKFKFQPVIKQGDSTKDLLAAFGGEAFQAVVGSPAYSETPLKNNLTQEQFDEKQKRITASGSKWIRPRPTGNFAQDKYGQSPGQMANLPEGDFQAVISSPPYSETDVSQTHQVSKERANPANPNYRPSWKRKIEKEKYLETKREYGKTDGQINQLPEGDFSAVVSSPPYEEGLGHGGNPTEFDKKHSLNHQVGSAGKKQPYATESGETYWSACRDIYFNCSLLLKPGGFIALVVKDFVRKKKRVPLCDQTWELLQSVGFEPVERNRAWLVEERQAATFFEANYSVKKERKSFFRRLAEKKGSPKIDYEEVLIARKPI